MPKDNPVKVESLECSDYSSVELNKAAVAALSGFEGAFLKAAHSFVIFPFGETDHIWSPGIIGAALRGIDLTTNTIGFAGPKSVGGGVAYINQPKEITWDTTEGKDGGAVWWVCKASEEGFQWGSSACVQNVCEGMHLKHALYLSVVKRGKAWVSKPLPGNQIAQDTLPDSLKKAIQVEEPTFNGFKLDQSYWLGEARWAQPADLVGHVTPKLLKELKEYFKA